jgi:general stress protein 26
LSKCRVDALLDAATRIVDDNPYGFLATVADEVQMRLVRHLSRDGLETIWIGTSPESRKAAAITRTASATYAVEDGARFAYVSLQCTATLVGDPAALRAQWTPSLEAFFPAGPVASSFILICLQPKQLEVMSFADRIHPEPYGLRSAVARRVGHGWEAE